MNFADKYKIPSYNHISKRPIESWKSRKQRVSFKPTGFWFGVKKSWLKFLQDEMDYPIKVGLKYVYLTKTPYILYSIKIKKINRFLQISSFEDLQKFHKTYNVNSTSYTYINWPKVAKKYGGFLVPQNYQKILKQIQKQPTQNQEQYLWFTALDGNTGCVWEPNIIETTRQVPL